MVIFGIMMTALSSFGQTFLLALYIPFLISDFSLSNSSISSFYGIATIVSATILPKAGKLIDTVHIKPFTIATTLIFSSSLVLFSLATVWWVIPIAFLGLRLAGQGLYSHISITAMSRYFDTNRGKAISLASLGHPLGQAVLPAIILVLIGVVGWRESLWINAGLVTVIVIVFTLVILKEKHLQPEENMAEPFETKVELPSKKIRQRDIVRSKEFWLLAPNVFFIPFATTGLFFYQIAIVDYKGWSEGLVAGGLTAFALAGAVSILGAGSLIDRYRAKTFFPFYLIPFLLAILGIWLIPNTWSMFVYMIFMGISVGFGSAILASLQVEFFGKKSIGSVRSIFMVLSSAVGPAVYGLILDAGWGWDVVFPVNIAILIPIIIQSFRAMPRYTRAKWKFKFKRVRRKMSKKRDEE